jgi:hypothetical protein
MRADDDEIYLEICIKRMYAMESSFTILRCQGDTSIYAVIASSCITLISTKTPKSKIRFCSLLASVCEHKGAPCSPVVVTGNAC